MRTTPADHALFGLLLVTILLGIRAERALAALPADHTFGRVLVLVLVLVLAGLAGLVRPRRAP